MFPVWRVCLAACIALAFSVSTVPVNGELSMLFIIHRHGTRTRLAPDGKELPEDDSILAYEGMLDMHALGVEAKSRYTTPGCNATTCLTGNWTSYDHKSWFSVATATDWTLQSSQAFSLGLLGPIGLPTPNADATSLALLAKPGGIQPVPVHSYDDNRDWILRSYSGGGKKCPPIAAGWDALYKSPEWAAKVQETSALFANLTTTLNAAEPYTLKGAWDLFDDHNTQRMYRADTLAGGPKVPRLDDETFDKLKDAAHWLEWHKYANRSFAGPFCGGGLLSDIVNRIEKGGEGPSFVEYSGHYRTLLCFFSALDLRALNGAEDANAWLKTVPTYAAHVAVEVTGQGDNRRVTLQFQNGPSAERRPISLPCSASATDKSCSFQDFKTFTAPSRYVDVDAWCKACGPDSSMEDCVASQVDLLKKVNGVPLMAMQPSKCSSGVPGWSVAVGLILGLLAGIAIGVAIGKFVLGGRGFSNKLSA